MTLDRPPITGPTVHIIQSMVELIEDTCSSAARWPVPFPSEDLDLDLALDKCR